MKMYSFLDKGILPSQGSVFDQSAKFIDAKSVIDSEIAEVIEEQRK